MNGTTLIVGRCSTFGGPGDSGMKPTEGVALYNKHSYDPHGLFMPWRVGLGRGLNPLRFYCAMRWNYAACPASKLVDTQIVVCSKRTGIAKLAYPVDWGPNPETGRVIDLSPSIAHAIGVETDDEVSITLPTGVAVLP